MKRYITIGLLVLVLGGALGFFFYAFWRKTQSRPLEHALLQSTSFYLSTTDALENFPALRNMPYGQEVYALPVFAKLEKQLAAFDSVLRSTGYTLGGTRMIASLYATNAEDFDWLFLVDGSDADAKALLRKLTDIPGAKVSERIYKDETVLDIVMPGETVPFSCASLNGILMGSFSAFLVEEGIVQLREKEPLEETDPRYRKISSLTNHEAELSIFINPNALNVLGKQVIDEERSPLLQHLGEFSSWIALDVNFRSGGILLGGYALPDSTGILSTFTKNATQQFGFERVLPINTAYFVAQEIELDLENPGPASTYLNGWLQPFACYGLVEPLDNNYTSEWFLVMPVTDEQVARESLAEMASANGGTAVAGTQDSTTVGQLTNGDALVQTLGLGAWLPLNNPYYTVQNGHAYFANDANTLKEMLRKVGAGLSLASNPVYVSYAQEVSSTNSLYIYLNPNRMGAFLPSLLLNNITDGKGTEYKNFNPIGLQFNYDDGVFFTIALLQYRTGGEPVIDETVPADTTALPASDMLAWSIALDVQLVGKPHLVTNHNTGELEVFVQDADHNIYLINKAGKILWKKKIDGAIMGQVYQMDLYKNSKLQLLFNTQQKLHLIDRNGNNVEQFPVMLAAKAVNGLFLMDDGKKNYQYFVACDNYKVYGYTENAKPLQGWNPKPRVGTIPFALQYTESQGLGYLIMTNVDGTLLYYNKNGERHEKPVRLEATFKQPFCIHKQGKSFSLINASESKILYSVDAKGNVKKIATKDLPPYHHFTCATVDSGLLYIFMATDVITFASPEMTILATFKGGEPMDLPGQLLKGNDGNQYLAIGSTEGNEIYLLDMAGQLVQGFPLKGNTQVAAGPLFDADKVTVVVGDAAGNVHAYRLP